MRVNSVKVSWKVVSKWGNFSDFLKMKCQDLPKRKLQKSPPKWAFVKVDAFKVHML